MIHFKRSEILFLCLLLFFSFALEISFVHLGMLLVELFLGFTLLSRNGSKIDYL